MPPGTARTSQPLMVREPTFTVLVERTGTSVVRETHVHRLEHHLRRVLPRLASEPHADERVAGDAPHPAVDVGEVAAVEKVEDPGGHRRPEVAVRRGHRAWLDRCPASESP